LPISGDTLMFCVTKLPVILIGEPRSGSDAFSQHIASLYPELKLFIEPNYLGDHRDDSMPTNAEWIEYIEKSDRYIAKFICSSALYLIPEHVKKLIYTNKPFIVCTHRRDEVVQMASLYVGYMRNQYRYFDTDNFVAEKMFLDEKVLVGVVDVIKKAKRAIQVYTPDLRVYYEDMTEFRSNRKITPKPINYDEIISRIKEKVEKY